MSMNSPCYGCEVRSPACHDRCDRYKEWKELRRPKKDMFKTYNEERSARIQHRLGRR